MLQSKIIYSNVMHCRVGPVMHEFAYPLYYYCFDIDELEILDKKHIWFGYNKIRLVSIHDKDYLASEKVLGVEGKLSIREKLVATLKRFDVDIVPHKVLLLTNARYFNYVFNPVSFFYCYDKQGNLECIIVEINNTFDERHLYILESKNRLQENDKFLRFKDKKTFHVSPFYDMEGDYDFIFSDIREELDIRINIVKENKIVFYSRLWETKFVDKPTIPISTKNLVLTLLRFPFAASLSMPRILWQAAKLYYLKKLPAYKKPKPSSPLTIKYHEKDNLH